MIYASSSIHSAYRAPGVMGAHRDYSPADDFLHAALSAQVIAEAHIFSEERGVSPASAGLQRHMAEQHITSQQVALLPRAVEEHEYIWVSPFAAFGSACTLRRGLGHVPFPICGIVHSLSMADIMGRMIGDIVRSEPCDALIATSRAARLAFEYARNDAADWLRDVAGATRTAKSWIEEIPVPVDLDAFGGEQKFSRDVLQLPADRIIVLCPGHVLRGSRDALDPVTSALKSLAAQHRQMMLLIGGPHRGRYANDATMLAQELGLPGGVHLIADVPSHLERHVYASADLFVSTDDCVQETDGLTAPKAMAAGLPVVVSDWGASRDLVEDGVNGCLVPTYWNPVAGVMMSWLSECAWAPQFLADRTIVDVRVLRDAIDALLSQPERRIALGRQARATVERTRSLPAIGRRLGTLWAQQQAIVKEMATRPRTSVIDYNEMFRSYATAELSLDLELRVGPDGRRFLGDDLSGPDTREVPPLLKASASQILERVRLGPVSTRACVESGSEFTFEAIVWLLRKGILSCDGVPQQSSAHAVMA